MWLEDFTGTVVLFGNDFRFHGISRKIPARAVDFPPLVGRFGCMPGPGEVGVQFHDGTPFTARHVEWSYKLTMKPEAEGAGFLMNAARLTELKGAQAFIDGTSEDIEGLTVVDDHTVVFETAVPNGNFFETVGRVYMLPEHLFRINRGWRC